MGASVVDKRGMWDLNEHFFDVIDTEEKAYWLGFIFADGYVAKDRPTFAMNMQILAICKNSVIYYIILVKLELKKKIII